MILNWTKEEARTFIVNYHMLNQKELLKDYDGVMDVFNRLLSIQYDPLNVVGRNSDLVLQSRIKNYKSTMINQALYTDRTIIDGWDKQMGIYRTKDFPYFKYVRSNRAESDINTLKYRLQLDVLDYVDAVLDIIQKRGPIYSSEIKMGESKKYQWGQTKPSSATLDYLFHLGKIGISERRNTQKRYDLIERLIPDYANKENPFKTEDDFQKWYFLRRLKSMGFAWNKSGVHWSGFRIKNKKVREKVIQELLDDDTIQQINVEDHKEPFYIEKAFLDLEDNIKEQVSFIAPLDNFIWDRELIKYLFDFEYTWEVYVPKSKRKYGYYVLPILYGNKFIGRIEFEQQRNNEPLIIKNFYLEENVRIIKKIQTAMLQGLKRFQKYLGASDIINIETIIN